LNDRPGRGAVGWWRLALLATLIAGAILAGRALRVGDLASGDGVSRARQWVEGLGAVGPLAFVGVFVLGVVAFVPGLPFSVLAGILFGPWWGTVYASAGSTLGACVAFLLARYAARDLVEQWMTRSPALTRLDRAAARHGFRLVMITRLVPVFPFNLQNYAYGLTAIRFVPYALTSWLCMLPATVAFTVAGGSLGDGGWDLGRRVVPWLGLAAAVLIILFLLSRWLIGKSAALADLVRPDRG
jgi:uncharacterized membrane protein YdjX (TVP38/TMEM64 family)